MPPNRKPTAAEHSIATWIVCSTGVISAWAVIWAVLHGGVVLWREGFFRSIDPSVERPFVESLCISTAIVALVVGIVCIVATLLRVLLLAVNWVDWARTTTPAAGPDDFDEGDVP